MRLAALGFVFVLASSASIARADDSAPVARVDDASRFADLVRAGDKARAAGKLSEAVLLYRAALDLKNDPVISGRLGLVALEGGALVESVGFLLRGVLDGQDAPPAERLQVQKAYDRARARVCRLYLSLSHLGAEVSIDGAPQPWTATKGEFYVFVKPGPHVLRARLAGYEDAVENIDAPKGKEHWVTLTLKPLEQSSPAITTETPKTIATGTPKPIADFPRAPQANPQKQAAHTIKHFSPWSLGFGGVILLGATSQLPAFGGMGTIDYKIGEIASLRLNARWAASPYRLNNWPISGWTIGVLPSLCANRSLYFICGQVHFGAIGHDTNTFSSPPPSSVWKIRGGIGASIGVEPQILGFWHLRIATDVLFFMDDTPVGTGGTALERVPLWKGPPVLGGLTLTAVWRLGTR